MKSNIILLLLICCGDLFGQSPIADMFPLNLGNSWTYTYDYFHSESPSDLNDDYNGTASYEIVSRSLQVDSTIWRFREIRDVIRRIFIWGDRNITVTHVNDSTLFELIEYQNANHRLVIRDKYIAPFRFLCRPYSDSMQFVRYVPDIGKDTIVIQQSWYMSHTRVLGLSAFFVKNIGLVQSSYNINFPIGSDIYGADTLIISTINAVEESSRSLSPNVFSVHQNFPNPFNPGTTISFNMASRSTSTIAIYDVLGRLVETIFDDILPAGEHNIYWRTINHASGTYLCVVRVGAQVQTIKLTLLK